MKVSAQTLGEWSCNSESREAYEQARKPGLAYLIVVYSLFALSFGGVATVMFLDLPPWSYAGPAVAFVAMSIIGTRKSDAMKATGAMCTQCKKRMTKVCVPLPRDKLDSIPLNPREHIEEIVEGEEGRIYLRLLVSSQGSTSATPRPKAQEIRQVWFICEACKQAFLADPFDRVDIGTNATDILTRERQLRKHRHLRKKYAGKKFTKG